MALTEISLLLPSFFPNQIFSFFPVLARLLSFLLQTVAQKIVECDLQLCFFCNIVPKSIFCWSGTGQSDTQDPDQHQSDADPQQLTWQRKEIFGMEK
jgi:hypothetical protein